MGTIFKVQKLAIAMARDFTKDDPFFLQENRHRIFNCSGDDPKTHGGSPKTEPELEEFFSPTGNRTALVRKYEWILACMLRLNCIRLVRGQDDTRDPYFNYSIVFLCSKRDGRGLEWDWKNVLTCLLLILGSIYILVKHLLRIYFLTELELYQVKVAALKEWASSLPETTVPQAMIDKHQQLKWWDSRLSLSYWPSPIFGRMFLANLWPIAFAFSLVTLWRVVSRKEKLRLDSLAFLLEPESESRRVEREIEIIIESLAHETIQMVDGHHSRPSGNFMISLAHRKQGATYEIDGQELGSGSNYLKSLELSSSRTRFAFVSLADAQEFVETLRRIKRKRLVRPAPSDKKFGSILLPFITDGAIVGLQLSFFITLAFFIPITIHSYFTYRTIDQQRNQTETYSRNAGKFESEARLNDSKIICAVQTGMITGQTYERINCTEMGHNPTRESWTLRAFIDQQENREKIDLGASQSFCSSHLWDYLREYWSVLIDISLFAVISENVMTLWLNIQFNSNMILVHWIRQIKNQLKLCAKLAENLTHKKRTLLSSGTRRDLPGRETSSLTDEIDLEKDQVELAECLTICYINYMLFRRRHKRSKRLMNFLISQIAIFATSSYTTVYISTDFHRCDWKNLILGTGIVLALCNIYLVLACLVCKSFEALVKQKCYLIAQLAKDPLKPRGNLIVSLWFRQLAVKNEIEDFIAPNFLGMRVSVEKLFSINTYILLFWFLMIR